MEDDDIIRWKGRTGKTKLVAVMVIRPASTRAKSFRLEIQAFRKRVNDSYVEINVFIDYLKKLFFNFLKIKLKDGFGYK